MRKIISNFLVSHTALLFITGAGISILMNLFFPDMIVRNYFVIPLFFYLLGLLYIFLLSRVSPGKPNKMMNVYMMMRVIKLFASLAIILLVLWLDKPNVRSFSIVFIVFFFLSLIWETFVYLRVEKYIKAYNDNQTEEQGVIDK